MTTAHDAEEALRPFLGRLYDAAEGYERNRGIYTLTVLAETQAAALDKALELLGVQP